MLEDVRVEFENERDQLQEDLQAHVRDLMGDTPINLNSPEQLSWVVYSRRVVDKPYWGNAIDPYMDEADFRSLVAAGRRRSTRQRPYSAVSAAEQDMYER